MPSFLLKQNNKTTKQKAIKKERKKKKTEAWHLLLKGENAEVCHSFIIINGLLHHLINGSKRQANYKD